MSEQKQVKVTLEELILTQADIAELYQMAEDFPHKVSKLALGWIETKIKAQLQAKVDKLQAEYNAEAAKLKAVPAEVAEEVAVV